MSNKSGFVIVALVAGAAILGGAIMVFGQGVSAIPSNASASAPSIPSPRATPALTSNIQAVDITAKGGYSPAVSTLRSGVPGVLRIHTSGTFDCSAVLVIPQLNYRTRLPMTGVTEVDIPPQSAGSTLTGLCGMGMYSFTIHFA